MAFQYTQADVDSLAEALRPGEATASIKSHVEALFNAPDFEGLYDWITQRSSG